VGDDARRQAHLRRAHRPPGARRAARDEILANRIYQELSAAVAGSQEFSRSPSSTTCTGRAASTS
jgi:hypothetical protein